MPCIMQSDLFIKTTLNCFAIANTFVGSRQVLCGCGLKSDTDWKTSFISWSSNYFTTSVISLQFSFSDKTLSTPLLGKETGLKSFRGKRLDVRFKRIFVQFNRQWLSREFREVIVLRFPLIVLLGAKMQSRMSWQGGEHYGDISFPNFKYLFSGMSFSLLFSYQRWS